MPPDNVQIDASHNSGSAVFLPLSEVPHTLDLRALPRHSQRQINIPLTAKKWSCPASSDELNSLAEASNIAYAKFLP